MNYLSFVFHGIMVLLSDMTVPIAMFTYSELSSQWLLNIALQ